MNPVKFQGGHGHDVNDKIHRKPHRIIFIMIPTDSMLTNRRVLITTEGTNEMLPYENIDTIVNMN